jgi:hypothetical protein
MFMAVPTVFSDEGNRARHEAALLCFSGLIIQGVSRVSAAIVSFTNPK